MDGEPVVEIDIKASFLTIYHARLRVPLDGTSDPYALAGIERSIAKLWMVASFGSSKPATRWPSEMIEDYRQETGKDLNKLAKAAAVAHKMHRPRPQLRGTGGRPSTDLSRSSSVGRRASPGACDCLPRQTQLAAKACGTRWTMNFKPEC
jgi:hypothetical protein